MSDVERDSLEAHLRRFILPQTGRALGESGTSLELDLTDTAWQVRVRVGFPAARMGAALEKAITDHCAELALDHPVEISVDSEVVTHSVQAGLKPLEGVANVIAIASGKGGVGKSTVAANMAVALAQEGAQVGILDADIYGPSQPRILGLTGSRPESPDGKSIEPLRKHGLAAMSIGFLVDDRQPMAWRGPMVTSALNQLLLQTNWGELDYLVIDMPPGTGDIQLTLAQRVPVSGAVIVTTPQELSLADARKGLEMFQKVNVPILGVVENMGLYRCAHCGHEERIFGADGGARLAGEYEVPLLGALPLDADVGVQTEEGVPTVAADPESASARHFVDVALRAAGELAASGKDYSRLFPNITVEEN